MEENIMNTKNNNKALIIIVIILVILVLGLAGYIAYDKGLIFNNKEEIKENDTQNDQENKKNETKIEELSISEAKKVFEENMLPLKNDRMYPTVSFNIKDITNSELISLAFDMDKVNYCIAEEDGLKYSVTLEEINTFLDKIVPDHHQLTLNDLKVNDVEVSLTMADYQYNNMYGIKILNDKIYLVGSCHGNMEGPFDDTIDTKIIKGTKEDKKLTIYIKAAFGVADLDKTPEGGSTYYFNYYKDYSKKGTPVETISVDEKDLGYSSKYNINYDNYNTYKYTFVEKDGSYLFQSVEVE